MSARLFLLSDKGIDPLSTLIENNINHALKNEITIFRLYTASSSGDEYAIISLSEFSDKIIKNYGGVLIDSKNAIRHRLKNYEGEPLYGDKSNVQYLDMD